jgi:hypothetical protein
MDPLEEAVRQRLGGLTNPLPKPFTFKDARPEGALAVATLLRGQEGRRIVRREVG